MPGLASRPSIVSTQELAEYFQARLKVLDRDDLRDIQRRYTMDDVVLLRELVIRILHGKHGH